MEELLLLSDYKKVFEITKKIAEGKYKVEWCTYEVFEKSKYLQVDAIIMHFDERMIRGGVFQSIIKVRSKLGKMIPILALIEGGSPQEIFSILKMGVFDYLENIEDTKEYENKITDLLMWRWYLRKYGYEKK